MLCSEALLQLIFGFSLHDRILFSDLLDGVHLGAVGFAEMFRGLCFLCLSGYVLCRLFLL